MYVHRSRGRSPGSGNEWQVAHQRSARMRPLSACGFLDCVPRAIGASATDASFSSSPGLVFCSWQEARIDAAHTRASNLPNNRPRTTEWIDMNIRVLVPTLPVRKLLKANSDTAQTMTLMRPTKTPERFVLMS